jgi:hypothetical protein
MPRELGLALVILLGVALLLLMVFSWRRRTRRQAGLGRPVAAPEDVGASIGSFSGLYLATTLAGRRLERVAIRPLGFRASGSVLVAEGGLVVTLVGSDPWFIPTSDLGGARRASWTIDRGVEEDGLNQITWTLRGPNGTATVVESYFRLHDPQAFDSAIAQIATNTEGTPV